MLDEASAEIDPDGQHWNQGSAADTCGGARRHDRRAAPASAARARGRGRGPAEYIDAAWRTQGYVPERETFTVDGVDCANLVITRSGRLDEILLIGVHYDTVRGRPGADANASGVAGLLELSQAFAALAPSPNP